MKRLTTIALVLVLALSLFAGCRSRREDMNTTTNTTAARGEVLPSTGDILPDRNDTVSPTNGANRDHTNPSTDTTTGTGNATHGTTDTNPQGRNRSHPMQ